MKSIIGNQQRKATKSKASSSKQTLKLTSLQPDKLKIKATDY